MLPKTCPSLPLFDHLMTKSLWQKFTDKPAALEAFQFKETAESLLILTDLMATTQDNEDHIVMKLSEGRDMFWWNFWTILFSFSLRHVIPAICRTPMWSIYGLLKLSNVNKGSLCPYTSWGHPQVRVYSLPWWHVLQSAEKKNTSKAINRSCASQKELLDSHKTVHHHCILFSLNCVLLCILSLFYFKYDGI